MAQVDETVAYDSPESFALRIKYEKHTLFIPVEPSTSYNTVLTRSLSILAKSSAPLPEESGFSSFELLETDDVALFLGSTAAVGGVVQDMIRFVEIDRNKEPTISKMGYKDGAEAVAYLGIRYKGQSKYSEPNVKLPLLVEDEDDEEDPDSIPPPLDDEDDFMAATSKGKSRA